MNKDLRDKLLALRHIALDMDGTIYMENNIFPFTLDFLAKLTRMGITYSFLTNNPTKSLDDYLAKLARMGIKADREQMYSTVPATIDYIKTHLPDVKRLFLLGTPSMISQFEEAGFESTSDSAADVPDAVVVAFDTTLVYPRLCRAAWWVSQGLPYLATNPDKVCPTDQPTILVDCGSLCKCIEYATGRKPDVTIGKPDPAMLAGIEGRYGLKPSQIAMVGDRLYTDIAAGNRAGFVSVFVLSGEASMEDAQRAAEEGNEEQIPDLIYPSVAEIPL